MIQLYENRYINLTINTIFSSSIGVLSSGSAQFVNVFCLMNMKNYLDLLTAVINKDGNQHGNSCQVFVIDNLKI